MNGGGTTPVAKIVVLARPDGPLRRQVIYAPVLSSAAGASEVVIAAVQVSAVATAYEAAAEILAGPTAALVVDLPVLTAPNVRLLSLAADLGVPAFGVGPLRPGLDCGDLHHLRQVCPEDLGELLRAACREFENSMRWAEAAEEGPESALEAALAEPPPSEQPSLFVSGQTAPGPGGKTPVELAAPAAPAPNPFLVGAATAAQQGEDLAHSPHDGQGRYVPDSPVETASSPLPVTQPFVAATQAEKSQAGMPELPPQPQSQPPADPASLLTSEELSALLREEP